MSRTPSTSTQEIQMDMFDHHPHAQVGKGLEYDVTHVGKLHKLCQIQPKEAPPTPPMAAPLKINRLFWN